MLLLLECSELSALRDSIDYKSTQISKLTTAYLGFG